MNMANGGKNYVFEEKFVKFLGLYKLLDCRSLNMFDRNGFRITIMTLASFIGIQLIGNVIFMYRLANDLIAFLYNIGSICNMFLM